MTRLGRWSKFCLVGLLGSAVQLGVLAVLNHVLRGHYLLASAIALEVTLLHNFCWHLRYTWRDRRDEDRLTRRCARFHLSNGLVSLAGNLALMRVLVEVAHLPVVPANLLAILACGLANFWLGEVWVFAGIARARSHAAVVGLLMFALCAGVTEAHGQASTPSPEYASKPGTDCAYENVFFGPSASLAGSANKATFTGGVTLGQYFARTLGHGITGSPQFELGIVGPLPGGHALDGLVSVDYMFANKLPRRHVYPFLTAGYTRLFVTGNAVNFGLGVDFGKDEYKRLVRVELRDYYVFTGPPQHVLGLRIAFGRFLND